MAAIPASGDRVVLRMGGAWAELAESERTSKTLALEQTVARQSAEQKLAAEQGRTRVLSAALERLGELADAAAAEARRAQDEAAAAAAELRVAHGVEKVLTTALAVSDSQLRERDEQQLVQATEQARSDEALEEAQGIIETQQAALAAAAAEVAGLQQAHGRLQRELMEERGRTKRAALGRQEKERQLGVLSHEKARLAGLLAKKDSMARELTAQLKRSEAGSPRPASAAGGGGGGADARAAPPAVGGKWPAQHETSVTPQVPGVQQRFKGWRDASGPQRHAALKAENAVLLCVLKERDAALATAQQEQEKLRRDLAAMKTTWRAAVQAKPTPASRAAPPTTHAATAAKPAEAAAERPMSPTPLAPTDEPPSTPPYQSGRRLAEERSSPESFNTPT